MTSENIYTIKEDTVLRMFYMFDHETGKTSQPFNGIDYLMTAYLNNDLDWNE
jgi:hypothetical protein